MQTWPRSRRASLFVFGTANGPDDGWRPRLLTLAAFCTVAGLWLLTHAYTGIRLDARIYMGRAVADLSPRSVGQDLMFAHDGQAGFSAFTLVARWLVAQLGPQTAAAALAMAGTLSWYAAMTAFVCRIAEGRLRWAMLACLAVAPCEYGGLSIIPFGEALAVPRPFAEAGVLAALSAVLDGRRWLALTLLIAASLFHPIMALCGFGVFFVIASLDDRRWLIAAAAVLAGVIGAAMLDLPLAGRLFKPVDPAWLDLLHRRNPYLFPTLWPLSTWSQSAVQVATALIAACLLQGRSRQVFAAAAVVAGGGVALAWLMGDVFPSLLVLQAQPWRALWLTAALGAVSFALCAVRLLSQGPGSRLAMAFIALAWVVPASPAALAAMAVALALAFLEHRLGGLRIGRPLVYVAWGLVALTAAFCEANTIMAAAQWLSTLPAGTADVDVALMSLRPQALIVAPLAIWAVLSRRERLRRVGSYLLVPLGVVLFGLGLARWDRVPLRVQPGPGAPDLVARLATHPGPVQWIDGDTEAWMLTNRAQWASELGGASIVFSRDEAMIWRDRMRRLISLGLVPSGILEPFGADYHRVTRPTDTALAALCRTPDGPAWIVTHVVDGDKAPQVADTEVWRAPRRDYLRDAGLRWLPVSTYALTRCSQALTPPGPRPWPGPGR